MGLDLVSGLHRLRPAVGAISQIKKMLADVLSVLAMTMSDDGKRESLEYKLIGSGGQVGGWGHEYVRHLSLIHI